MSDGQPFIIRNATADDVETIARHRAAMFSDIRALPPEVFDRLEAATRIYLADAIPGGECVGWLAAPSGDAGRIAGGAGVQVQRVLPFPRWIGDEADAAIGLQAIVLNVYVEPAWRRQGLARRLMYEVLAWARSTGLERLVLHAAPAGRALYEQLGFVQTSEMRFEGSLAAWTRPAESASDSRWTRSS